VIQPATLMRRMSPTVVNRRRKTPRSELSEKENKIIMPETSAWRSEAEILKEGESAVCVGGRGKPPEKVDCSWDEGARQGGVAHRVGTLVSWF